MILIDMHTMFNELIKLIKYCYISVIYIINKSFYIYYSNKESKNVIINVYIYM